MTIFHIRWRISLSVELQRRLRTIPKGTKDKIKRKIIIDESIHAPIKEGQSLGKIEYYLNSNFPGTINIVSTLSIEKIL